MEQNKLISKDKVIDARRENELLKEIDNLENLIKGYQKENEILSNKDTMARKEVEKLSEELKTEQKRNQQLQQQLLRTNNQALISNETIDLNKTSINNLIIGGETISIQDLKELKNKNKFLNETLLKTINDNKQLKEKEVELNEMVSNYKYKIEELELKTEGIDIEKQHKDNDILAQMTREFKLKEDKQNDKIKALEGKIKFQVETQELIDQKYDRIEGLEEKHISQYKQDKNHEDKEDKDKKV